MPGDALDLPAFSLKAILLIGLVRVVGLRYLLLGYGSTPDARDVDILHRHPLLHGVCFDFFFMTGRLSPTGSPAKSAARRKGLLAFLTYGVGMFIGSLLSGVAVDFFTTTTGTVCDAQLDRLLGPSSAASARSWSRCLLRN